MYYYATLITGHLIESGHLMEVQMYVHLVYTLLPEKTGYESHWKGKNKVLQ